MINSVVSKSKWNSMEVLVSKASSDSNISYNEIVSIKNVLKEHDDMKEQIKKWKT